MIYEERVRTIGLCLVLGLATGGVVGCMFRTEFLLYAGCLEALSDCDPAWGEARTPQACFAPHHDGEDSLGYCTVVCEQAEECPAGEGVFADWPKQCIEAELRVKGGGHQSKRVCALACDGEAGEPSCPGGMVCQMYKRKDGNTVDLCFSPDSAVD